MVLIGGLPGVGRTTVAREVARRTGAAHVRIDALEAALVYPDWAAVAGREVDAWAEPHAVVDTAAGDPVAAVLAYGAGSADAS